MKKWISFQLAGRVLFILLSLLAVFHVLTLLHITPPNIVWGGQAGDSSENLFVMELISLVVTLFYMVIVAIKIEWINLHKFEKVVHFLIWIMFLFFVLSMFGNLVAGVSFERMVFAPFSLILALLALRLGLER